MTDEILTFFQSLKKAKFRIPIFGKSKIQNSNVWKSQKPEFQCLEKPKFRIPIFGKAKLQITNLWTSQKPEFQCLEKPKFRIAMFGKAKIQNCNVWKSQNQFYLEISSVNTRRDNILIGAIGFEQVSMAVENASNTLVINMVSMTRKHITVDRALG